MTTAVKSKFSQGVLFEVMGLWDLRLKRFHPEMEIAGSPERSEFRVVVETDLGDFFILEEIFSHTLEHKRYIVRVINQLEAAGLESVIPYRKNRIGEQIIFFKGSFWQVQPFFPGIKLERPAYAFEEWRGKVLADFLINLCHRASVIQEGRDHPFSLKRYISHLMRDITRCDPQYLNRIEPVFHFLKQSFFSVHDQLPTAFCHGDYHPINVLWTPRNVGAVIDWEFCGYKRALYDAANMVGCLGIEHPDSLGADCVLRFLHDLKESGIYDEKGWRYFFELLLAIRFAWMSEWLRKKDIEMVEMECDYWDILMNNRDQLKMMWHI